MNIDVIPKIFRKCVCFNMCMIFIALFEIDADTSTPISTMTTIPDDAGDPFVNTSKLFPAYLRLLYIASGHTDVPIFEKGYDLTPEEQEKFKIWPEGEIPYFVDMLSFDLDQENKIHKILEDYNKLTGLNFYPIDEAPEDDDDVRWVLFANRRGQVPCLEYTVNNFTNEGMQRVILGWNCLNLGVSMAPLILAIVGIPPQHNSPDRDEYIEVLWDNILPEKRELYTKLNDSDWLFHKMKYDFSSAGHYSSNQHAYKGKNAFNIIKKMEDLDITDGRYNGLSYRDIKKIKMLYNYISRNRTSGFNETRRMNDYEIDIIDDGSPRPKPHRYLGIPEPVTTVTTTSTTKSMTTKARENKDKKGYHVKMPEPSLDEMLMFMKK